jgi:tetratricopeptide (TPR) repeat protein
VRLAHGLTSLGEPARAEAALRLALADAERMGLRLVAGYALQNLGHALAMLGRHEEAQRTLERTIAAGTALGDGGLVVGARIYLADVAREAGRLDRAEREASLALADAGPFAAIARATLARVLAKRGDAAAAEIEARAAMVSQAGASEGDALVALALAEALDARGERDAARRIAREALERVRARASKVADPVARTGLLTRVPEHARLAALAT